MSDNNPEIITIQKSILLDALGLLDDGLENEQVLLREHDKWVGRSRRIEQAVADAYEKQIAKYSRVIQAFSEVIG
jgi:hypothetical protein